MDSGMRSRTGSIDRECSSAADRTFTLINRSYTLPFKDPHYYIKPHLKLGILNHILVSSETKISGW
jgi:hypothetical protein